jgi:hypothetical protein
LLQDALEAVFVQLALERLHVEHIAVADHGAARQAAGNDLGQRRHVGCHPVELLRAARAVAKPGDHLVEDQNDAARPCQVAQLAGMARRRKSRSTPGLDDDRCDLVRMRVQQLAHRVDVVGYATSIDSARQLERLSTSGYQRWLIARA